MSDYRIAETEREGVPVGGSPEPECGTCAALEVEGGSTHGVCGTIMLSLMDAGYGPVEAAARSVVPCRLDACRLYAPDPGLS